MTRLSSLLLEALWLVAFSIAGGLVLGGLFVWNFWSPLLVLSGCSLFLITLYPVLSERRNT